MTDLELAVEHGSIQIWSYALTKTTAPLEHGWSWNCSCGAPEDLSVRLTLGQVLDEVRAHTEQEGT